MNLIRYKQLFLAMLPVMLLLSTVPSQAYVASNRYDKYINESAEGTVSPTADLITAKLGSQFQLKLNHTAMIEPSNIKVRFVKVTQDTRCPTGAQCVSEGQARILVSIMKNDKKILDFDLTLIPEYLAFKAFDKYSIRFVKLEPYPSRGELIRTADYTATMIVEQVRPDQSPDRVFLKGTGEFRILAAWSYEEMKGIIITFQQNAGRSVLHLKLTFADCVHFSDSDDCIVISTDRDQRLILMPIRLEIDKNNMKLFFQTLDKIGEEHLFDIEKVKKWPLTTECRKAPYPSDALILKNRTWISVARIDSHDIGKCTIATPELISKLPKVAVALKGADGCKDGTEVCEVSYGISRSGDSEDYELSLSAEEARSILEEIGLRIDEYRSYGTVVYDNKYYLLELFTTDEETGVQAEVSFAELIGYEPILLRKGDSIAYMLTIKTWATYGKPAELDLQARASARDSGLDVRFEPSKLVVPERSEASVQLIITAGENARDGRYEIAASVVVNNGGGGFLPACHHSSSCAVVQIGDSDWQIRTYGSDAGGSIGGKKAPEWLRVNVETNKAAYSKGESVEIKAYITNDREERIVLDQGPSLIIQVLGSSGSLYGIDARIFDGEPVVLEPKSRTLLARPFYWDQETFISLATPHQVDQGTYTLDLDFAGYQGHVFYDQKKIEILE